MDFQTASHLNLLPDNCAIYQEPSHVFKLPHPSTSPPYLQQNLCNYSLITSFNHSLITSFIHHWAAPLTLAFSQGVGGVFFLVILFPLLWWFLFNTFTYQKKKKKNLNPRLPQYVIQKAIHFHTPGWYFLKGRFSSIHSAFCLLSQSSPDHFGIACSIQLKFLIKRQKAVCATIKISCKL